MQTHRSKSTNIKNAYAEGQIYFTYGIRI